MSNVTRLHDAVKRGDVAIVRALLDDDRSLANSVSESDPRLTYPLHVAAEFGQAEAARLLIAHGADPSLVDVENDATALGWAAFFGRPGVVAVLLEAGAEPTQRNKHGLTPLDCALGGTAGRWTQFSNATVDDWRRAAEMISAAGGKE
jgi:ankyrin repeat protein